MIIVVTFKQCFILIVMYLPLLLITLILLYLDAINNTVSCVTQGLSPPLQV